MDGLGPRTAAIVDSAVALVSDGHGLADQLEPVLKTGFATQPVALAEVLSGEAPLPAVAVFCLKNFRRPDAYTVSLALQKRPSRAIFVFPSIRQANIDLAREIGADECMMAPVDGPTLLANVRRNLNQAAEAGWAALPAAEAQALRASRASFDSVLAAASAGEPLPLVQVNKACERIQASLGASNVNRWLGALRQHHDNTYRHSMFVCGVLAYFARSLGITGDDLRELTVGGFLHDAGKAKIPLAILDKPAKLDADEMLLMRTHPGHSRDILLREHGLSTRVVRMAVHHHEKLDGTGYPDSLAAAQIEDTVRLTAIADVYAALAEERAYKPAMPPEKALEVMAGFQGHHLDPDLLRAFRTFILDQANSTPAAA